MNTNKKYVVSVGETTQNVWQNSLLVRGTNRYLSKEHDCQRLKIKKTSIRIVIYDILIIFAKYKYVVSPTETL